MTCIVTAKEGGKSCKVADLGQWRGMGMNNEVMWSSKTMDWATPQDFFDRLDEEFHFTLDPCADEFNHKCAKFYTKEQDGLMQGWAGESVFCNPPYGRDVVKWVRKCFREVYAGECRCAVMLLPARTDTKWFHDWIYQRAEIRFVKGRLKFGGQTNSAPFPTMVVIFKSPKWSNTGGKHA